MTIARRPSPFGELVSLRAAMDRLFEDSFVRPRPWAAVLDNAGLPLDIRQTQDELIVQASLPGVKPEDVDITVENGTLTISAESRAEHREEGATYLVSEIRRGSMTRSVSLPEGLEPDRAAASFEDGLLTLTIPRAERVKPRTIRITPTSEGAARETAAGGSTAQTGTPSGPAATSADA